MFGQIKENIVYNLDQVKNNPTEFKKKVAELGAVLKSNKGLQEVYHIYEMVEQAEFENEVIAKEFLDECLVALRKSDIRNINQLRVLAEGGKAKPTSKIGILDSLVFEDLDLKAKYDAKTLLIKNLTKSTDQKVDYNKMIVNLDKKVTSSVGKLTTEQKEALEIFIENDESKLNAYYTNLIDATATVIDSKILTTEDVDVNKILITARKKLIEYRTKKPTIDSVDNIIELKNDLNT